MACIPLVQKDDGEIKIPRKRYPKQIGQLQPRGELVNFAVFHHRDDNGKPQGNENKKAHDKRLHIEEEYIPREIEYKANGVHEQRIVLFV